MRYFSCCWTTVRWLLSGQMSPFNAGGLIYLPHSSHIAARPHVHMDTEKTTPPSVTVELGEKCDKQSDHH